MRKIIATIRPSQFRVGNLVTVDGDAAGGFYGEVIATHSRLEKLDVCGELVTAPGITLRVLSWDGTPVRHVDDMQIIAHDFEVNQN